MHQVAKLSCAEIFVPITLIDKDIVNGSSLSKQARISAFRSVDVKYGPVEI